MSSRAPQLLIASSLGFLLSLSPLAQGQTFLAAHFGSGADGFGDALAFVGDMNADGRPDYLIGDYADDTVGLDAGRVELRSGQDHSLLASYLGGDAGHWFGCQVAAMDDLDNDGVPDWAVSSPREVPVVGATRGGRVALRSGATGAVIRSWTGAAFQELGEQMHAVDDLDGDGLADLMFNRKQGGGSVSTIEVRSSASGALLLSLPAWGPIAASYAYSIAPTGDLDGDGLGDLALASDHWLGVTNDHRLRFHSSVTGALIHEILDVAVPWPNPSLAVLDDLDNDGVDDLAYAQTNPDDKVTVLSGATFSELWSITRPPQWGSLGRGIMSWPDVDGDGRDELAVQYHQGIGYDYRLSLRSGLDGTEVSDLRTDITQFKNMGARMVRGPDLDGDGGDDILLGCSTPKFWNEPGAVRVVSGTCTGTSVAYGSGLAGSGAFTPQLSSAGCPAPGVSGTLRVRDGLGGAPATLLVGFGPASVPFKQGTLVVDPVGAVFIHLPLSTPQGTPGAGNLDLAFLVPDEPLLSGFSIYLQVLVKDVGAPAGWAMTGGLHWTFG